MLGEPQNVAALRDAGLDRRAEIALQLWHCTETRPASRPRLSLGHVAQRGGEVVLDDRAAVGRELRGRDGAAIGTDQRMLGGVQ